MTKLPVPLARIKIPAWTFPFLLLALCVLSFGLLAPWLGFYQDDWHAVFYASRHGVSSLWELYFYDNRPLSAWPYMVAFPLLGLRPLNWHLFLLAIRWLTATTMWLAFGSLWPQEIRGVRWAAILFTVYPLFKLQPLAVAYTQHWTSYLLYSLSILAMIASFRRPRWFWPLTLLALSGEILHLVTVEYFSGVELARPAILFLLARPDEAPLRRRVWLALRRWFPYLLALAGFILWRVYWMPTPGYDNNAPVLLYDLLGEPVATLFALAQTVLQDSVEIIFASWYKTFGPDLFQLDAPADLLSLLLVLISTAGLYLYLARLQRGSPASAPASRSWVRQALATGALVVLLGPLPAWVTGQSISSQNPLWSDRLGLPAMFGASLVIVSLLEILVGQPGYRKWIFCALVGLSIGWHFRSTNEFRWAWEHQRNFYQQLSWRAPSLEPGTAILSNDELFQFMGDYPTAFAINTLYPQPGPPASTAYWFFAINPNFKDRIEELRAGMELREKKFSASFRGKSLDSLLILYEIDRDHCLWVLRPEDTYLRGIPEFSQDLLPVSNLARIHPSPSEGESPLAQVFSAEPGQSWCYYYQKGDLARQFEDWPQVAQLWEMAAERGLQPQNGFEFLPFIESYAHLGDWKAAQNLTVQADRKTSIATPALCAIWEKFQAEGIVSSSGEQAWRAIQENMACVSP